MCSSTMNVYIIVHRGLNVINHFILQKDETTLIAKMVDN